MWRAKGRPVNALILLALGMALAVVAWGAGRLGGSWAVLAVPAGLPMAGLAIWFILGNDQAMVSDQFDQPGLSGALLGALLAGLSSPLWIGGYILGRKRRV